MTDPVTIGTLAAAAIAMLSDALVKGFIGAGAKDAYEALKERIKRRSQSEIESLEKAPQSAARQASLARMIDAQLPDEKALICTLVERLVLALQAERPVGLDIAQLDALNVKLGAVTVTCGTGVRIADARVMGTFETGDITVGRDAGKR